MKRENQRKVIETGEVAVDNSHLEHYRIIAGKEKVACGVVIATRAVGKAQASQENKVRTASGSVRMPPGLNWVMFFYFRIFYSVRRKVQQKEKEKKNGGSERTWKMDAREMTEEGSAL